MRLSGQNREVRTRLRALIVGATLWVNACAAPEPLLCFLDEESNISFSHPPRWTVGFAEQDGVRYRYLTAPNLDGDATGLSVTMIAPATAASANAVAEAYLAGATSVAAGAGAGGAQTWTFKDPTGVASRLWLTSTSDRRFFGAWVRGSDSAMQRYGPGIGSVLASLRVEDVSQWSEERFAGMVARAPTSWTHGSRLSNRTNAAMQFKSPPLAVEKGTSTVHGFASLSKEPIPPPGDLEAFRTLLAERVSDTVALLEHRPWLAVAGIDRAEGRVDLMRSGNTMTSTRIRRWITVKNGVGLTFTCEARADVFDRLDPWCRRMAYTVSLE